MFELKKREFRVVFIFFVALTLLLNACSLGSKSKGEDFSGDRFDKERLGEQIARYDRGMGDVPETSSALFYFMLGELALKENSPESALNYFEEASEYEERSAPLLRKRLGQLYLHQGEIESAMEELALGHSETNEDLEYLQLYAGILSSQKKYDEAIGLYRKVISLSPSSQEYSLVLIANTYEQKGDLSGAKLILDELITTKPNSIFGYYYRARVFEALKLPESARADFKKAIALGGAESVLYDYARFLATQSEFEEAQKISKKILKSNPSNTKVRHLMGRVLLKENKVDEALAEYEELTQFEADPSETRLKIAIIKIERGDFQGAENELRLMLNKNELNAAARYYLGSALAGQKKNNQAVEELLKIKRGKTFFLESRMMASFVLRQEGKAEEAAKVLTSALAEGTPSVKHLAFLASLQKQAKDFSAAQETTKRIIEIEPDRAIHYFTLGVYYDRGGMPVKAEKAIRKAISMDPKNADALNYLGYSITEKGGDYREALDLIEKAVKLQPENGYFIDSLGWVYYKMGERVKALKHLERAVRLVPNDSVILEHLAILQNLSGNKKGSLETLNKARDYFSTSDDKEVVTRVNRLIEKLEKELSQTVRPSIEPKSLEASSEINE